MGGYAEEESAARLFKDGETCNIRRRNQDDAKDNPGIPVLIRYASPHSMSADLTMFPGNAYQQQVGGFNLVGWERVETTLDKLRKAQPGSFVVVGVSGLKLVKIGEDSWVTVGPLRRNGIPLVYRDTTLSGEGRIKFLDN